MAFCYRENALQRQLVFDVRCNMNLAEQINQTVKPLPESAAQEILDFVLFPRRREENAEWQNLMLAQSSALADWNNEENEVWTMYQPSEDID